LLYYTFHLFTTYACQWCRSVFINITT